MSAKDELGSFERPEHFERGRTTTAPSRAPQRTERVGHLYALTLHRPWAWAIAHDNKRVENRTWSAPAPYVGHYVAIHAGKHFDIDVARKLSLGIAPKCPLDPAEHPLGIVAVARLVRVIDCRLAQSSESVPDDQTPWAEGPYAWLLDDVVTLLEPIEATGKQGLWPVEGALYERARDGWRRARREHRATSVTPAHETIA